MGLLQSGRSTENCERQIWSYWRPGDCSEHLHTLAHCPRSENIPSQSVSPGLKCGQSGLPLGFFSCSHSRRVDLDTLGSGHHHLRPHSALSSCYLFIGEHWNRGHNLTLYSQLNWDTQLSALMILEHDSSVITRADLWVFWSH